MSKELHCTKVIETAFSRSAAARSRLAASWRRSVVVHGLDPSTDLLPDLIEESHLKHRRERLEHLLYVAAPKLDALYCIVGLSGCGVVLTDADGVVLEQRFSDADAPAFKEWGLWQGTNWSEEVEGTNGIGTCLAEDRSVIIHRDEHFHSRNIGMSCIDVPIYGAEGQLIAALDVSSARVDQTEAFNHLIAAQAAHTGHRIEASNFSASFPDCRIIVVDNIGAAENALLAVNEDDIVVGATRAARKFFDFGSGALDQSVVVGDILGRTNMTRGFDRGERAAVTRALARLNGNVSQAAKALFVSRATLYRRMKRLGIHD
jgi:transcriptional regulator of acetoin/glycerol metabolism